jgi:thiol reductant ABC exporter CydD subunit
MRYASGVRTLLVASVLLGIAAAVVVVVQAVLIAGILADVIIDGQGAAAVSGLMTWLALVIAVRAGLAWATEEIARRSASSVTAGLRRDLLRRAAALGPRWRSGEHGGELAVLATSGVESLHDYISRYLPQLVLSVVVPLIMLGYLFTADLTSALIVACTLPLIPLFMALVGWYTDRQTRAKWASLSRLAGHFTDVVAGLPTLKVFGRAKAQAQAVRSVTDDYRRSSMVTLRVAFLSSMVLELLASLSVALVAVAIGLRLVYGDLTLQVGLAVLILAPEAYLPLRQLGTQFHAAADGVAATAKVLAILDTRAPSPGTRTDLPAVPGLRVAGTTVGTAGQRGSVGPLWLDIPAGRITVITGESGVGKTTLLQLLAGVQRPDSGQVLVVDDPVGVGSVGVGSVGVGSVGPGSVDAEPADATGRPVSSLDLTEVEPHRWREQLAWAGQGAAMQAGSIRDNLALGNPGVDDATLRAALEAVDAAAFVDDLPDGWRTILGEAGAGISQGQRQRLSLARALARPASLVLLDEPTAALDEPTEQRVLAGIAGAVRGRTVVLVTHRPGPLARADQVIALRSADDARSADTAPGIAAPMAAEPGEAESLTSVGPW